MTALLERPADGRSPAGQAVELRAPDPGWVASATAAGLLVTAVAAAVAVLVPQNGALLSLGVLIAGGPLALLGSALHRNPAIAPWGAVLVFATSAELRLRVDPAVGVLKDLYVVLLVVLVACYARRRPETLHRLRPLLVPVGAMGVLVALYLVNPAGVHGTSWLFGTRLLLEVLVLLGVGVLLSPHDSLRHLVGAMSVVLPAEAAFAWVQQVAGAESLVFTWGYQYGAQVRATSSGGLRVAGTFEDPFQLAALAVLGLTLALFVASRRQAWVLIPSAAAVLAATSVRTALVQVGIVLVVYAVRRGWWRQAAALAAVAVLAGILVLATTSTSVTPGAEPRPLLLTLNGRFDAWSLAVEDWQSLVTGNGVGAKGIGSTRETTSVSAPPAYDGEAPPAFFAGDPAFLDSSYAQVQSDVGIVGVFALMAALVGFAGVLVRRCRGHADAAAWAAMAVLAASVVDWVGRSSLASYTTGFLTLYVLGIAIGASSQRKAGR